MTSVKVFEASNDVLQILTASEAKMLPILKEAVKLVDKIFLLQEHDINNGANLYPRDATKKEILEAAKKNPKILSPFTVVRRDKGSKLIAVDYHKEYKTQIQSIVNTLTKTVKICKNPSFKNYLETIVTALPKGEYRKIDIAWLNLEGSNLNLTIGPYERYLDKLFFAKKAFQGSLGIVDKERTKRAKFIRDILYTTTGSRPHRVVPPSIVDIQVEESLILAGFVGRAFFSRQHLPADTETTTNYGSRIFGFLPSINYKFEKLIYPIFNTVFEKNFRNRYSKDLLKRGNYYYVLLTAIAQQLHRYRNSRTRLRELFPILDEANCVASGIQHAKHLVLKGVIDQKELEAIMIAQICWGFSELIIYRGSNVREDYLKGDALIFNFLVKVEALQEKGGVSWPNFAKMFFEMENLSIIFTRFLEEGSYAEAQEFLYKYLSLDPLKSFDERLSNIKSI